MHKQLLTALFLAGLGLADLHAQSTILWSNNNGGDLNGVTKNWTGSKIPGAHDIAQFGADPTNSTQDSDTEWAGLNLNVPTGLTQTSPGVFLDQLGAVQITSARTSLLWIGIDAFPASTGEGTATLQLNGATINDVATNTELSNVIVDEESFSSVVNQSALSFQLAVGPNAGNGPGEAFNIQLGSPAVAGNNTFVVMAAAPSSPTADSSIAFVAPIIESVAGSSVNYRGGGTSTVAGALINLQAPAGTTNSYTGGSILGNSSQTSLANADGVILKIGSAASLPATGNVLVNNGSTLWLLGGSGGSTVTYGNAGQTLTLNGNGSLNSGQLISSANLSSTSNLGALLVNPGNMTTSYAGSVDLQTDSTIAIVDVTAGFPDTFTLSGTVEGAGKLTKIGGAILDLSSANNYSGGTEIEAGTVEASNDSALGNASSAVQIDNGGKLSVDAGIQITQTNVALAYGGSYVKKYNAGESLAGSMSVQSANGMTASLGAGQAGSTPPTLTAAFATTAHAGTVTGETTNLSGLGATITPYALELNLAPGLIDGNAQISTFNSSSGMWVAAVTGNSGNVSGSAFFNESFAQFESANGVTDANLSNFMGDYGTDAATGQTWAVLDFDGQFSVTDAAAAPEPSTWTMLALGAGVLFVFRCRAWALASGLKTGPAEPC